MSWPDLSLPGWSIEAVTVPSGKRVFTCRRMGVTWQLSKINGHPWRGVKFYHGRISVELESARLPVKTQKRLTEVWNDRPRTAR